MKSFLSQRRLLIRRKTNEGGFTLIEMMVAVFVVSIMVSVIVPHLLGAGKRAQETAVTENEQTIRCAIEEYYLIHHTMPNGNSVDQLNSLVADQLLDSIPVSLTGETYQIDDADVNHVVVTIEVKDTKNNA